MSAHSFRLVRLLVALFTLSSLVSKVTAEELWVSPTHSAIPSVPPALDVVWPVTSAGVAAFGFSIPDDMSSFVAARVVLLPAASGTGSYSVFTEVKRDGEVISPFDIEPLQNVPLTLSNDEVTEVDITPVFGKFFDATSGGRDYVSVLFYSPDLIANARVLGLRFVYDPPLVGTAQLAPNAVDSTRILDGSITAADIADGMVANVDIAPNAIDGSKILDGAVGSAEIANGSVSGIDIQDLSITGADISGAAAIAASKIFGDAGVEFVSIGVAGNIPTTLQNLGSLTLDAPTSGFAIVGVTATAIMFGEGTEVKVGLGSSAASNNLGETEAGTLDGTGTLREEYPLALFRVVPVAAGPNTFFINAVKPSVFDAANVNLGDVYALALFVPKRY